MALTNFKPSFPAASSVSEGLTATAGGGQAAALALVSRYNHVTTVATAGDSVALPPWLVDWPIYVANDAALALALFPYGVDQIGTLGASAALSIPAGKTAMLVGTGTYGKWMYVLSA